MYIVVLLYIMMYGVGSYASIYIITTMYTMGWNEYH